MSWEQLGEIWRENDAACSEDASRRAVACPHDGLPLQERVSDGTRACRFCGWTERGGR